MSLNNLVSWVSRLKSRRFMVGVLVLLSDSNGRILIASHRGRKKKWAPPGGQLQWPESIEMCACREILEELSLKIETSDIQLYKILVSDTIYLVDIVVKCNRIIAEKEIKKIKIDKIELSEIKWVNQSDVINIDSIIARHRDLLLLNASL